MTGSGDLGAGICPRNKLDLVYRPGTRCYREFYHSEAELALIDPYQNEPAALDVLRDVSQLLSARAILHHVCDGTLLGIVRQDGFIEGDNDIDFRIAREALTPDLEQAFENAGFILFKRSYIENSLASIGVVRDGIAVDLYGTDFTATSETFQCIFKHAYLSYHLPFHGVEQMEFRGMNIWVPKNAVQELVACYGPDWQQPETSWDGLFDHQALVRCTGGVRNLFTAALRFQNAPAHARHREGRGSSLRGMLRAMLWLRWA
ncbi:MAG: hypothetical protein GYB25_14180 [Rhodobacteraceae bacterium]|nr:hypothetical protein [Paracoccaceae bacterium]